MYLQSLSVSNLLSFIAHDHSNTHHTILWSGDDHNRVNIVIGPNSSGKSNMLEIINQTLRS
jgi:AAA15 family ATPase/GTPase